MNNRFYNQDCGCGCDHGAGVYPGPYVSPNCGKPKKDLRIKTELLPASVGTDEKGQPYAPKLGRYFNTVVQYAANDATYIYDSQGVYTKMNSTMTVDDAIAILKQQIAALQTKEQSDVDNLQENINQLANKEAEDVEDLQANINAEVNNRVSAINSLMEADNNLQTAINAENTRAYNAEQALESSKQGTLVSGTNIKTINGESILGEGNMTITGGSGSDINLNKYVVSGPQLDYLIYTLPTTDRVVIRGNIVEPDDPEGGASVAFSDIPAATSEKAGVMTAADKAKLDSLSAGASVTEVPTASYTADNVNLTFGEENVELTPAVGTTSGSTVSKAGIMSAFQASQLEALAAAYEAEEKGTVLYEGTASVNNIELSESGLSYDHLIVVAQYMGMGSFALEQQVSAVFYPTDSVKAFQMNATDITTGNAPMVQLIQDIWSITDDGMEIELASSLKATVNSETTVEPDTTSNFTITKVVGFGKKLAEA